jgi:hypothetical protein
MDEREPNVQEAQGEGHAYRCTGKRNIPMLFDPTRSQKRCKINRENLLAVSQVGGMQAQ